VNDDEAAAMFVRGICATQSMVLSWPDGCDADDFERPWESLPDSVQNRWKSLARLIRMGLAALPPVGAAP
jgi:hypothetical protein